MPGRDKWSSTRWTVRQQAAGMEAGDIDRELASAERDMGRSERDMVIAMEWSGIAGAMNYDPRPDSMFHTGRYDPAKDGRPL